MKVIALKGESNIGKTTTLNLLYRILVISLAKPKGNEWTDLGNNDFLDILLTFDNQVLGIVSQGDFEEGVWSVASHLQTLYEKGCQMVICAANKSRTKIEEAICNYSDYEFIDKTISSSPSSYTENLKNNLKDIISILELLYPNLSEQ